MDRWGKYFRGADGAPKMAYILTVIEYQHRGLPHAHIVYKIHDVANTPSEKVAWMSEHIQARFPTALPHDAPQPDVDKQAIYEGLIQSYMMHKCVAGERGCKDDKGRCRRGYMDRECTTVSKFDSESGFPIYSRPHEADLAVVPHNRLMLEDWQGHINVEACSSYFAVLYLYKYLFKGNKKVTIYLNNVEDLHKDDEISHYIRGRMLCSMEAAYKILGYQMYPASVPTVIRIKVKTQQEMTSILALQNNCDLAIYFARPQIPLFANMLYTDFFKTWMYANTPPKKFVLALTQSGQGANHPVQVALRGSAIPPAAQAACNYDSDNDSENSEDSDEDDDFDTQQLAAAGTTPTNPNPFTHSSRVGYRLTSLFSRPYIFPRRSDKHQQLVRMGMVPLSAGEKWYMRLLLLHASPYSFDDLRTVAGHLYPTYQEAAIARGLVTSKSECMLSFEEYRPVSTAPELRSHFVLMTLQGYATLDIYNEPTLRQSMMSDFLREARGNEELAQNMLLQNMAQQLALDGRTLEEYGLPDPQLDNTELDRARLLYSKASQNLLYLELTEACPFTEEMTTAFNRVDEALQSGATLHLNLLGKAGCGKSTWAKAIVAYVRSKGKLVCGCASTALAAGVYKDDWTTAHYIFGIPVMDDEDAYDQENDIQSKLDLPQFKQRKDLLMASTMVVWDEVGSQHNRDFSCAWRITNGFEGKILITIGDNRQITPVVKRGTKEQILASSYYQSTFYAKSVKAVFTKNLRLIGASPEQLAYAQLIDDIGSGSYDRCVYDVLEGTNERTGGTEVVLKDVKTYTDTAEAVKFVHPNGFDGDSMADSCILAATNDRVNHWNSIIQDLNPNPTIELRSHDEMDQCDDPNDFLRSLLTTDVLNRFSRHEIPDHVLSLKEGDVCILLRNMDRKRGFTSNRRVRIVKISTYAIRVKLLDEPTDIYSTIPRINFNATLPIGRSFTISRKQFPLRLAYSLSINRAQGQTLNRVMLDITVSPFSHGHLYVAMSRVRFACNIAFFCMKANFFGEYPFVLNTVYPQLLNL